MTKIPFIEINCIPSQLNTSAPTGVASQLASMAEHQQGFDGVTIEQMRGNPLYGSEARDKIDKVGLAQKKLVDAARIVSEPKRAKVIRALNDGASMMQKPSSKN